MKRGRRLLTIVFTSVLVQTCFTPRARCQTFGFQLPTVSCPMAHCTPGMTDQQYMTVPVSPLTILTQDRTVPGSGTGLGVSSNGFNTIAVSYKSSPGWPFTMRTAIHGGTAERYSIRQRSTQRRWWM